MGPTPHDMVKYQALLPYYTAPQPAPTSLPSLSLDSEFLHPALVHPSLPRHVFLLLARPPFESVGDPPRPPLRHPFGSGGDHPRPSFLPPYLLLWKPSFGSVGDPPRPCSQKPVYNLSLSSPDQLEQC